MEVKDQLLRLVRLQEVADQIRSTCDVIDGAPGRLEEIESRFRERNAEYVEVRERFDAIESDQRQRSGELELLEEHRKKYMDDLMQVTNQREYAAMLREIDTVKSRIGEHEEAILHDLEEIEELRGQLASHETHIKEERERVEQEGNQVRQECEAARERLVRLEEERKRLEADLPRTLVGLVQRLEDGRRGVFLARAEDGVCQSCYVRIRPQVFQEIRTAAEIHTCSNCRRILFHEPSLRRESTGDEPGGAGSTTRQSTQDPTGVEALNRGPA